jgi:NitT/TauT family transport system substrate-binding protein
MKLRLLGLALAAASLATVGGTVRAGHAARTVDKVRYATSFGTFGRDAYVYVALAKGWFDAAGIDVTVTPGTGSETGMKLLAAGQLDFTPVDITAAVLTRANEGLPVKIVSIVHQRSLSAILALAGNGITTNPKTLEGKTVADSPGSTVGAVFPLYAKRAGIDASKVHFVPAAPPALPSLLASGRVDAVGQFSVGVPLFQAAAGGRAIVTLPYQRYLPGLMGIGIATTDAMVARNPGLVRRFVAVENRALAYALAHPDEAGQILQHYAPLANPQVAADELRIMRAYVVNKDTRRCGIGWGNPKRIGATISIVNNGFHPKTGLRVRDIFAAGFVKSKCR